MKFCMKIVNIPTNCVRNVVCKSKKQNPGNSGLTIADRTECTLHLMLENKNTERERPMLPRCKSSLITISLFVGWLKFSPWAQNALQTKGAYPRWHSIR